MRNMTRRQFLQMSARLAALMGIGAANAPQIAEALEEMISGNAPVLWLQGQSCSGCSVSVLNAEHPGPAQLLTRYISLQFHSTLSTATGDVAMDVVKRTVEQGDYILVVEGSIPVGMPEACMMGHESLVSLAPRAAARATAVIAVGTCAAFGGIPAAENNPTGAKSVPAFLKQQGIRTPTIVVPGCPVHPDWLVGTLVHALKFGLPPLDAMGRPKMFFGRLVHEQCPRYADYESERFARKFGDEGCLFKLGCVGPDTYADCTLRQWNSGTNYCIRAGAPCIGCAGEHFAGKTSFPFFRKSEASLKEGKEI